MQGRNGGGQGCRRNPHRIQQEYWTQWHMIPARMCRRPRSYGRSCIEKPHRPMNDLWDWSVGLKTPGSACLPGLIRQGRRRSPQLQEFRSGLGPDNSPLGRLLIDQLAVCWLEANYLSTRAAETASEDTTATHREFLFRGADRAHRRLAFLLKQLTTVRNLLRSASRVDGTTNSNAATPAAAVSTPPCGRKRRDKSR